MRQDSTQLLKAIWLVQKLSVQERNVLVVKVLLQIGLGDMLDLSALLAPHWIIFRVFIIIIFRYFITTRELRDLLQPKVLFLFCESQNDF